MFKRNLIVLICISEISSEVEHIFICLLDVHISCNRNYFFTHLDLFFFFLLVCLSFFLLICSTFSDYQSFVSSMHCKYFLPDCGISFTVFVMSFFVCAGIFF